MNTKIKVAILEDLKEIAQELSEAINQQDDLSCNQIYGNAEDAILFLPKSPADILIVDIGLPRANGIVAIEKLHEECPSIQFCMFTVFEDDDKVFDALKAGAKGYILKRYGSDKIVEAIRELHMGGSPMSPSIARRILEEFSKMPKPKPKSELPLTEREFEILNLIADGLMYKQVADKLFLATGTIKQNLNRIYAKLQVSNKTQAINKLRNGT